VHKVFEGAFDQNEQDGKQHEAEEDGKTDSSNEDNLRFVNPEGPQDRGDRSDAEQQHRDNRNKNLPLPADSGGPTHDRGEMHGCITSKTRARRKGGGHNGLLGGVPAAHDRNGNHEKCKKAA